MTTDNINIEVTKQMNPNTHELYERLNQCFFEWLQYKTKEAKEAKDTTGFDIKISMVEMLGSIELLKTDVLQMHFDFLKEE